MFQKGNTLAGSRKGKKNRKTEQWELFSEHMLNGGLVRFQQELETLEGKDYVNAVTTLMEFFKPKLARVDSITVNAKPDEIFEDEQADKLLQLRNKILDAK